MHIGDASDSPCVTSRGRDLNTLTCSHGVRLEKQTDVDAEVKTCLKRAHAAA